MTLAYDALVLVGFGGPTGPDDVMPFLQRVTAGRPVPLHRLEEVAARYLELGGTSPIVAQTEALLADLVTRLAARGLSVPAYLGHRNCDPTVPDTLAQVAADGHTRVLALASSAFPSYSGCRQYRENLGAGLTASPGLAVRSLGPFPALPGFVEASADLLATALASAGPDATVLVTAHSLPLASAATSGPEGGGYVAALERAAAAVLARATTLAGMPREPVWRLVFQSRSGSPQVPWLEPDVCDAIREIASGATAQTVLVVPLGFLTDHTEVLWDLDREAADAASAAGLGFIRVPTVGTHPAFLDGLADLLAAHLEGRAPAPAEPAFCSDRCCPSPTPGRPASGVSAHGIPATGPAQPTVPPTWAPEPLSRAAQMEG